MGLPPLFTEQTTKITFKNFAFHQKTNQSNTNNSKKLKLNYNCKVLMVVRYGGSIVTFLQIKYTNPLIHWENRV